MNSVSLQQVSAGPHKFTGLGWVGFKQIAEIEKELESTNNSNSYRILVLHHHIVPILEPEEPQIDKSYSLILDAGRVNCFVFNNNISLVLHGHAHEHSFYRLSKDPTPTNSLGCYIVGLGSADINRKSESMFALLTFDKNKLQIEVIRTTEEDDKKDTISTLEIFLDK